MGQERLAHKLQDADMKEGGALRCVGRAGAEEGDRGVEGGRRCLRVSQERDCDVDGEDGAEGEEVGEHSGPVGFGWTRGRAPWFQERMTRWLAVGGGEARVHVRLKPQVRCLFWPSLQFQTFFLSMDASAVRSNFQLLL